MEGNQQNMREQLTKARAVHCDPGNDLTSKASSGIEASTCNLEPPRESSSESGFFKRKCPFWGRKKTAAKSPQEEAASKSRLCVEAAHESPIPAVRKPVPKEEGLRWDPGKASAGAKPGCSLLRKLLCLKAVSSRPKKPPQGPEASPLCRASMRCGPVAALSRTADPQGESPLRWKPRAENQAPAEATSGGAEVEVTDITAKPEESWVTKPWRTFRAAITSRVKKRSVLPGPESDHGTAEDGDLCDPTEPEISSFIKTNTAFGEPLSNMAAIQDPKPSGAFPASVDNAQSIQENKGSHRVSWHGLEIHRTAEDDTVESDTEAQEGKSVFLTLEGSQWEQNPTQKNISEWESLQKQVYHLSRGNRPEEQGTAMEDEDLEQGGCGYWVEGLSEEEQDLADLAENPGGQGMLMGMRDLGWLKSELLGGSKSQKTEQKVEREIHETQESREEKAIRVDAREGERNKPALGLATDVAHRESFLLPPHASGSNESHSVMLSHYNTSGVSILEEEGTLFAQEGEPLELSPSPFSTKGSKQGLLSPLPSKPCDAVAADNEREGPQGQTSPTRKLLLSDKEAHRATAWWDATGPGTKEDKQLIYMAAVEIVGAAIDAATTQLARKKEEEEQAESGFSKEVS